MSVFTDCRKKRDRVGRCTVRVGRIRGGVYLTCLLTLVGFCRMEATAIAADSPPHAAGGNSSTIRNAIDMLSRLAGPSAGTPNDHAKTWLAEQSGHADGLTTETETPEDYKKIAATSPYPPTDVPEKLTLEQLETIAKLAPRSNSAGIRVHPAMVPLFRSMVVR